MCGRQCNIGHQKPDGPDLMMEELVFILYVHPYDFDDSSLVLCIHPFIHLGVYLSVRLVSVFLLYIRRSTRRGLVDEWFVCVCLTHLLIYQLY